MRTSPLKVNDTPVWLMFGCHVGAVPHWGTQTGRRRRFVPCRSLDVRRVDTPRRWARSLSFEPAHQTDDKGEYPSADTEGGKHPENH